MQCDQRVLAPHVPEHAVVKVMLEQFTLAFEMLLIHWLLSRIIHDHTHYTYTILTQKQCHSLGTFTAVKSLDHCITLTTSAIASGTRWQVPKKILLHMFLCGSYTTQVWVP